MTLVCNESIYGMQLCLLVMMNDLSLHTTVADEVKGALHESIAHISSQIFVFHRTL